MYNINKEKSFLITIDLIVIHNIVCRLMNEIFYCVKLQSVTDHAYLYRRMKMDTFLTINLIAFILVVLAALYLFIKAVMTRYSYIQLGQKKEFDLALKDRLRDVLVIVFGQSKLLKDKKSGAIHVMMFYGFILV